MSTGPGSLLDAGQVRPAGPGDCVDGLQPAWVVCPASLQEAASALHLASERGLAVIPRGRGTKLEWGGPARRADMILSTERLDRILSYSPGDLVVRAQAGLSLSVLQATLAEQRQMLALDPAIDGSLGGIVATNDTGPSRLRYGAVRDLLIGLTYVLPDGTIARAGGNVVKNVAGYDLCKLFTGSLGTLGLIGEVTFRLHPQPQASTVLAVELSDSGAAGAATQTLMQTALVPTSVVVSTDPLLHLSARFEGGAPGVEEQMRRAAALLAPFGPVHRAPGDLWPGPDPTSDDATVKIAALPADLVSVLGVLNRIRRDDEVHLRATSHAALGLTFVTLSGPAGGVATAIRDLRQGVGRFNGSAVIQRAPLDVRRQVDVWGEAPALALMRRIKAQFDPAGTLNPGRYVGGI